MIVTELATAIAMAVAQADAFCEADGGEGTNGCSATSGQIDAVASATVSLPMSLCSNTKSERMRPQHGRTMKDTLAQSAHCLAAITPAF